MADLSLWMEGWVFGFENLDLGPRSGGEKIGNF
jgi:hypothetical protein